MPRNNLCNKLWINDLNFTDFPQGIKTQFIVLFLLENHEQKNDSLFVGKVSDKISLPFLTYDTK